jgi:hypothetical protein
MITDKEIEFIMDSDQTEEDEEIEEYDDGQGRKYDILDGELEYNE